MTYRRHCLIPSAQQQQHGGRPGSRAGRLPAIAQRQQQLQQQRFIATHDRGRFPTCHKTCQRMRMDLALSTAETTLPEGLCSARLPCSTPARATLSGRYDGSDRACLALSAMLTVKMHRHPFATSQERESVSTSNRTSTCTTAVGADEGQREGLGLRHRPGRRLCAGSAAEEQRTHQTEPRHRAVRARGPAAATDQLKRCADRGSNSHVFIIQLLNDTWASEIRQHRCRLTPADTPSHNTQCLTTRTDPQ